MGIRCSVLHAPPGPRSAVGTGPRRYDQYAERYLAGLVWQNIVCAAGHARRRHLAAGQRDVRAVGIVAPIPPELDRTEKPPADVSHRPAVGAIGAVAVVLDPTRGEQSTLQSGGRAGRGVVHDDMKRPATRRSMGVQVFERD